jgi:hypothetical protein
VSDGLKSADTIWKIHIIAIFEYFKFKFIHDSISHIYIQIIAKYITIFKFIVCTHLHIVKNSIVHQLFTEQILHNDKVEGTPLTFRSCQRMRHLYERSHGARTCKYPL